MIRIRAYGYLKIVLGKSELEINRDKIKIKELIDILSSSGNYKLNQLLLLIIVNGVEISALDKDETIVNAGDEVILVPVHGE